MSSKDVKSILKLARECIEKKDFVIGSQHCKRALEIDGSNYMALVLQGACLQEGDKNLEALSAFKKATELNPDLPLAWKGLCTFYEKRNKETDRVPLLEAYINLFNGEQDIKRAEELSRKIGILLSLLDLNTLVTSWHKLATNSKEKQKLRLMLYLSVIGEMDKDISEDCLPIIDEIINEDDADLSRIYLINTYKKYLKQLYKSKQLNKVLVKSREMYDKFPGVVAGPEWFCKAYLEAKFGVDDFTEDIPEPSEMYMVLLKNVPDSYLAYTCKGVDELACQEFVAACESLYDATRLKPSYGISWYLLTQGQSWLQRFSDAEHSARQALLHWKASERNVRSITNCKYWLAKALSAQDSPQKLAECVRIADEFLFDNPNKIDFTILLVKACIKLRDCEKYSKYMKALSENEAPEQKKLYLEALWNKSCGNMKDYSRLLIASAALPIADSDVDNYEVFLELGKMHFDENELKQSMKYVLKATKMNEWCSANYRYLGHIYRKSGDIQKARRCYQKAFTLCPTDEGAGIGLSDIYRILGLEDNNMKLLTIATTAPGARWAWLKMGLHFLAIGNPVEAVNSLRVAVRLNPEDSDGWESLGDAYLALGSFSAASKSYQKVEEFGSNSVYPQLQMAMCKHMQGEYEPAVIEFRRVLGIQPDFLPGLKAHAVSCLALMRQRLQQHLIGLAADSCQEAVSSLCKTLAERQDLICIWKLLGDACLLMSQLPEKYCKLEFNESLTHHLQISGKLDKIGCLTLAVSLYSQAIALAPYFSDLWHDLALCYYRLAGLTQSDGDAEKTSSSTLALAAVKKSLTIVPTSWMSWNLLGLISMLPKTRNYPVAQHSYLKAISLDDINAVPWCNLGTLYLILGDLKLANQSFTEAQRCNPDYVQCWVGQAMIAEKTGHHEAIDLYRHSTQLGFDPQGAVGYCSMVLTKLVNAQNTEDEDYVFSIKNMNAVVIASDCATWYTERHPEDPCGWNMLGLLMERLGLNMTAAESFVKALIVQEENNEIRDKLLLNSGRLQRKVAKLEEAITSLKSIKSASFESVCLLAEAQKTKGLFDEAYETYQCALEWLADEQVKKSAILFSMAAVMYQHKNYQDCKLLLMQACQLQPVPIAGLFACCALGLLQADLSLAELAIQELAPFQDQSKGITEAAFLKASMSLIMNDPTNSIRILRDTSHKHPEEHSAWLQMGVFHLQLYPLGDPMAARSCFDRYLQIDGSSSVVDKVLGYCSLASLLAGDLKEAIRSAKKAVHLFPMVANNWVVLVAAVLNQVTKNPTNNTRELLWLKNAMKRLNMQFELSGNVKEWLSDCLTQVNHLVDSVLAS